MGQGCWDKAQRDIAVRHWLNDLAKRIKRGKVWERWYVAWALRDAYDRGYNHGYLDGSDGTKSTRSM